MGFARILQTKHWYPLLMYTQMCKAFGLLFGNRASMFCNPPPPPPPLTKQIRLGGKTLNYVKQFFELPSKQVSKRVWSWSAVQRSGRVRWFFLAPCIFWSSQSYWIQNGFTAALIFQYIVYCRNYVSIQNQLIGLYEFNETNSKYTSS